MFNVTIIFNSQNSNVDNDYFERIIKARQELLNNLTKKEIIKDVEELKINNINNQLKFRISFGGTDEFLQNLSDLIWHFRVLDQSAKITLEVVPAV